MIVLDTNVLSELMRPATDGTVRAWLDAQQPLDLFVTAITVAEILYGIRRLPDGKRKTGYLETAALLFDQDFAGRILAFDAAAAMHHADMVREREQAGRPIHMADAQIAAICRSVAGISLATRNGKDFAGLGLNLIDPWSNDWRERVVNPDN